MSDDYSWENDWPRITVEWPHIRDVSDGSFVRPVFSETPCFYFQQDAMTPRVEITREEYERIDAEWKAARAARNPA